MPQDAKSFSLKVQPNNVSSVTSTFTHGSTATTYFGDIAQGAQKNSIFDIPCVGSPSQFLDNCFNTLNFKQHFQ
jgi:hypothetical protein